MSTNPANTLPYCHSCESPTRIAPAQIPEPMLYKCCECSQNAVPSHTSADESKLRRRALFAVYAYDRQERWTEEWTLVHRTKVICALAYRLTRKDRDARKTMEREYEKWAAERAKVWGREFDEAELRRGEFTVTWGQCGAGEIKAFEGLWLNMEEKCGLPRLGTERRDRWAETGAVEVLRLLRERPDREEV